MKNFFLKHIIQKMKFEFKNLNDKNLNVYIKSLSKDFNFDICRITKPDLDTNIQNNLKKYMSNEFHGEMSWMENTFDRRKSPKSLWPDARSAIVLGMNYGPKQNPINKNYNLNQGNISVYALGEDYHKVLKGKIKQFASKLIAKLKKIEKMDVKVFVDTAPLMEKPIAQMAGIGWQGKHTNLVSQEFGSWLFLGVLLVNKTLYFDNYQTDLCGNCNSCINACPTNAIVKPYQLDARKCISYLTIEYKGKIPVNYRKLMGNKIYGCDDCLSVCPWNKFAKISKEYKFHEKDRDFDLSSLLNLKDVEFRKLFSKSPVKRIGIDRFLRNCCIAAGNSRQKKLIKNLKMVMNENDSEVVKDAAFWAINELEKIT